MNRASNTRLFICGALLILAALALGIAVNLGLLRGFEPDLMRAITLRESRSPAFAIEAFRLITHAGDPAQRWILAALAAAALFWRRRRSAALVMLVVPAIGGVAASLLKQIFGRPRPDLVPHLDLVTSLSFPSGHASNVMAILLLAALLLAVRRRALWILFALLSACLVGGSRAALGVHWPSDIIGGWWLGAGVALIGLGIARAVEAPHSARS